MERAGPGMAQDTEAELANRLQSFVGQVSGSTTESYVNPTVINRLLEAVGDANPIYFDPAAAAKSPHGEVVAPATMLMCWSVSAKPYGIHGIDETGRKMFRLEASLAGSASVRQKTEEEEDESASSNDDGGMNDLLKAAGYLAPAVTNGWFEYKRYFRPGERLTIGPSKLVEILGPKKTSLGLGYFTTTSQDVFDEAGELVAVVKMRMLRSKPVNRSAEQGSPEGSAASSPSPRATAAQAPRGPWKDFAQAIEPAVAPPLESVSVGDKLPGLVVELTPTSIIAGAIASQDYAPVHHDRDFAQQMGHPEIFMNIQTSTGYVGRYITDWAGPDAVIELLDIRLGVPNYAYDTMTIRGEITQVEPVNDRTRVTVAVVAENSIGRHITSTVTLNVSARVGAADAESMKPENEVTP